MEAQLLAPFVNGAKRQQADIQVRIRRQLALQGLKNTLRALAEVGFAEVLRFAAKHLCEFRREVGCLLQVGEKQVTLVGLSTRDRDACLAPLLIAAKIK